MGKYDIDFGGIKSNADLDLTVYIKDRYKEKQEKWESRNAIIEGQQKSIKKMLPISSEEEERIFYSARNIGQKFSLYYTSVLPQKAFNFLLSTKLHADFIDFVPQRTMESFSIRKQANDISNIHALLRSTTNYEEEVKKADIDLARFGESYMFHNYKYSNDGACLGIEYRWISWKNVRGDYNSTDWIIVQDMSVLDYIYRYGENMVKKITLGGMLDGDHKSVKYDMLSFKEMTEKTIQVVMYFDTARKIYAEFHGSSPYQYKLLKGERYPFTSPDGDAFIPIQRRKFYEAITDWHGYGILDLLIPLARTETSITNSTLHRAILSADTPVLIASNDPTELERKYTQYLANRQFGQNKPFFIPASSVGSHVIKPEIIDTGVNNSNFQIWRNFVIDEATMRTGIDFRVLINYAPTAEQARLRKQEQDRVNRSLIQNNALAEKKFALEDIYLLKAKQCKFNSIKIYLKQWEEELESSTIDPNMLKDKYGNLPQKESTVGAVLSDIKNFCFDIKPRLEGAFDDQTYQEVLNLKEDMMLVPPGSKAQMKIATAYFQKVHPQIGIQFEDFFPPQPQQQSDEGLNI